jgi:hypothetical protein
MEVFARESWFVHYYLTDCSGNGVQAYLKVWPNAKYQSAKASASRLLKKPSVIESMEKKLEKLSKVGKAGL